LVEAATGRALAALLAALLLPILVGATSSGRSPRRSVAVDFYRGRDRKGGKGTSVLGLISLFTRGLNKNVNDGRTTYQMFCNFICIQIQIRTSPMAPVQFRIKYGPIWTVCIGPRKGLGLCPPSLSVWVGRSPCGPTHLAIGDILIW
jgi:hypothetical protein